MKTARTLEGAALALALATTLVPSRAHAGDDDAVVVVIEDPSERVDVDALREGISADLGVPLATETELAPDRVVRVRVLADGSVEVEVETAGATRRRVVAIPDDRSEATRIIVLLSANLVCDESAELLSGLVALEPAPQVIDDRAGELSTPVLSQTAALASPEVAERYARGLRRPSRTPAERNFRVAFTFRSGAYDTGGSAADPFLLFGAELAFDIGSMGALGIGDFGLGGSWSSEHFAIAVLGTPYVELHAFVDRRIELYGRLGAALQGRSQTYFDEGHFQLAAYVGGGARFYVGGNAFFIGLEVAMHIVDAAVSALVTRTDREPVDASETRSRLMRSIARREHGQRARLAACVVGALLLTNSVTWAWSTERLPQAASELASMLRGAEPEAASTPSVALVHPPRPSRVEVHAPAPRAPDLTPQPAPDPVPSVDAARQTSRRADARAATITQDVSPTPIEPIEVENELDTRDRESFATAHELHFEGTDPRLALSAWDRYLAEFPAGRFVPEAQWNRALCLVRLHDRARAVGALAPFAEGAHGGVREREARAVLDALERR